MNLPKISIITIVYNGQDTLEKTILSIQKQTYPHIEYIIVDGNSTDNTTDIIKQYSGAVSKWISEPDKGLYHAMNKGIEMATGDYFWFINSGDEIAEKETLLNAIKPHPWADIYYGDTVMIDQSGSEIGQRRLTPPEALSWKDFRNGMLVSHQSIIVSRLVAQHYNEKYRFSADFEWCLLALKKSKSIVNTQLILSRFLDGGITKQNILPGLIERFKIMKQHFGFWASLLRHIVIALRFFWYLIIHKRF